MSAATSNRFGTCKMANLMTFCLVGLVKWLPCIVAFQITYDRLSNTNTTNVSQYLSVIATCTHQFSANNSTGKKLLNKSYKLLAINCKGPSINFLLPRYCKLVYYSLNCKSSHSISIQGRAIILGEQHCGMIETSHRGLCKCICNPCTFDQCRHSIESSFTSTILGYTSV